MTNLRYAACLVHLYLTVVYCQTKYCCTPTSWESVNIIEDGRVSTGTQKPTFTTGLEHVAVDGVNHRVASKSELNSGGFNVTVQVIQLFDKKVMYMIESGECKSSALDAWVPKCVPDNAVLVKQTYYGLGDGEFPVDIYSVDAPPNTFFLTMSHKNCVPVAVSGYGSQEGVSAMSVKTYTNVTLGIKDDSIFNVPSICNNATRVNMPVPNNTGHPL